MITARAAVAACGIFLVVVAGVIAGSLLLERFDTDGGEPAATVPPATADAAAPVILRIAPNPGRLDGEIVKDLVARYAPARRRAVLESAARFADVVEREAARQSVIAAAIASDVADVPAVRREMRRAAEQVVAEVYLGQVVQDNFDPGFPNEKQIAEYYALNAERFGSPGTVELWQLYLAVSGNAAAADVEARAASLAAKARADEAAFRRVAGEHSEHTESHRDGGYLGFVPWEQLREPVRAVVETLAAGETSDPIRTAHGFHVVRRGRSAEAYAPPLSEVHEAVVAAMRQEARAAIRRAAVERIRAAYPVVVDPNLAETWRLELEMSELEADAAR